MLKQKLFSFFPLQKATLVFILLLAFSNLFSQRRLIQNLPSYDKSWIHFGFFVGYNNADFIPVADKDFHAVDTVYNIRPNGGPGFNLQIVTNLRISDNFDLRFLPGLSFSGRDLNYNIQFKNQAISEIKKTVESNFVDLPLELKFKSTRINNFRMYVLGGFKYSIDLASKKGDKANKDKEPVRLGSSDYGYEVGFGMDFYLTYIKVSPEIKMFTGLQNLLIKDRFVYSSTLDQLYSKIFTFSVTFE